MIPKFHRPLSAFALYMLAAGSLAAGVTFLLQEAPIKLSAILIGAAIVTFGLARLIHLAAELAHYAKYLCWEQRLANQLAERKKSSERKIPPPLHFPQMDPMEKVFRHVDET